MNLFALKRYVHNFCHFKSIIEPSNLKYHSSFCGIKKVSDINSQVIAIQQRKIYTNSKFTMNHSRTDKHITLTQDAFRLPAFDQTQNAVGMVEVVAGGHFGSTGHKILKSWPLEILKVFTAISAPKSRTDTRRSALRSPNWLHFSMTAFWSKQLDGFGRFGQREARVSKCRNIRTQEISPRTWAKNNTSCECQERKIGKTSYLYLMEPSW